MAKPSITKRSVKGAALTYSELDTNFQNLADATLSVTAGTGGTQVTSDLNGNITLVAGTNVTLSGDNNAKTITITASGGSGSGTINTGTANRLSYYSGTGTTLDDALVEYSINLGDSQLKSSSANGGFEIATSSGPYIHMYNGGNTLISTNALIVSGNSITLGSNVLISSEQSGGSYIGGISFGSQYVRIPSRTTTERDAISSPQDGMMIYNSTTGKFQGRAAGAWVDLH